MRAYAFLLGVLSLAFAARFVGQLLVAAFGVEFLPPMETLYSGLISYPALLPIQLVILAIQLEISRELWVGAGAVSVSRPVLGRAFARRIFRSPSRRRPSDKPSCHVCRVAG